MKSALCLSGHLRTFEATFPSFKENVIDPMNCDVFIHTWNSLGAPTKKNMGDIQFENKNISSILNTVHQLYQPKKIIVEEENNFQSFKDQTNHIIVPDAEKSFIMQHLGLHVAMFYSIFKANQLKSEYEAEHNFKYDRVIRCRPDLRFNSKLEPHMFPDNMSIYLPEIAQYCNEGVNDQVAIGSSFAGDVYALIYNHIIDYYANRRTTARPEAMVKFHLDTYRMPIKMLNISYDMYRLDGTMMRQHKMWSEVGARWK